MHAVENPETISGQSSDNCVHPLKKHGLVRLSLYRFSMLQGS
jgi:hypothetical protein